MLEIDEQTIELAVSYLSIAEGLQRIRWEYLQLLQVKNVLFVCFLFGRLCVCVFS